MDKKEERDALMTEMVGAVKTLQDTIDESNGRLDTLENDTVKKASESATKAVENLQEIDMKVKAFEERQKDMELAMSKKSDGNIQELEAQFTKEFNIYLRDHKSISEDVVEKMYHELVETKMFGLTDTKIDRETKDMVAGSNPDGGYFITPDRMTSFKTRLFETSPVRLVATVQSTSSDTVEWILDDEESAVGWVGEVDARPNTNTAQIGLLTIPVHEIYANPKATQKMLDNAGFNLEQYINQKGVDKIARTENTSFVLGNGSKKPKGFLDYSAWAVAQTYERDALEQVVGTDSTAGFNADDLITLQNRLHEEYQVPAVFGMTRTTFSEIMKMKGTDGHYLLDRNMLHNGADRVVLGKKIIVLADMPELATDSLSVIYGDFGRGYTIVDRIGIRILRDPYSNKPYVLFYMTKGVGGAVTNYESLKILKSNTVS